MIGKILNLKAAARRVRPAVCAAGAEPPRQLPQRERLLRLMQPGPPGALDAVLGSPLAWERPDRPLRRR